MLVQLRSLGHDAPQFVRQRPLCDRLVALRRYGRAARLSKAQADSMEALLQTLERVLGKRLVFFEDGAAQTSFDENWLLNLFDAVKTGDADRYCFALRSRMGRMDAAELHFSVCKAALTLDA